MNRFIELTIYHNGSKIEVVWSKIESLRDYNNGAIVQMDSGDAFTVKESAVQIKTKIQVEMEK